MTLPGVQTSLGRGNRTGASGRGRWGPGGGSSSGGRRAAWWFCWHARPSKPLAPCAFDTRGRFHISYTSMTLLDKNLNAQFHSRSGRPARGQEPPRLVAPTLGSAAQGRRHSRGDTAWAVPRREGPGVGRGRYRGCGPSEECPGGRHESGLCRCWWRCPGRSGPWVGEGRGVVAAKQLW